MAKKLIIVLAQLNLTVGDIDGNLNALIKAANDAKEKYAADIIVYPELSLTGYPPEDLLLRKSFLAKEAKALEKFKDTVKDIYCVIGHTQTNSHGLFNACSVIYNGTIIGRYSKQHLPNYGVFDECRYFIAGNSPCVVNIHGIPVGVVICEDTWFPNAVQQAANQGARLILSLNASPFEMDKHEQRHLILSKRAKQIHLPIFYVNNVGGQDELVFDGGSMVVDAEGKISQFAGFFEENLLSTEIEISSTDAKISEQAFFIPSVEERVYSTLVLGLKDYIEKNNIPGIILGVSGGIDSALSLCIAIDALGKDRVQSIMLPSQYTSEMSMEDGLTLIKNAGVKNSIISIDDTVKTLENALYPTFDEKPNDLVEQNLQSRARGIMLMAFSNQTGKIVLTTGNRSEMATGYATLYGDMVGGFNVLKDVSKTWVYRLARYRNALNDLIPLRIIERAPSAELKPNQKDSDTLPEYDVLDAIIELYINQELSLAEIVAQGFSEEIALKTIQLINRNEYKRRQAPIGVRVHHKAFSKDRRYPITSGNREN